MTSSDQGFIMVELMLWLGLILAGTFVIHVKVTRFWDSELERLQKERIPYTGGLSWRKE